ncbi:MAG: hypothetical protein OEZ34_08430 [Spirochaetia bacterium]|nr:hypothetical protein [Spirochaetia bacterium]
MNQNIIRKWETKYRQVEISEGKVSISMLRDGEITSQKKLSWHTIWEGEENGLSIDETLEASRFLLNHEKYKPSETSKIPHSFWKNIKFLNLKEIEFEIEKQKNYAKFARLVEDCRIQYCNAYNKSEQLQRQQSFYDFWRYGPSEFSLPESVTEKICAAIELFFIDQNVPEKIHRFHIVRYERMPDDSQTVWTEGNDKKGRSIVLHKDKLEERSWALGNSGHDSDAGSNYMGLERFYYGKSRQFTFKKIPADIENKIKSIIEIAMEPL